MNRPWAALGLVLALCVIMPRDASAQGKSKGPARIGQNYPNPFNPVTKIDFAVGDPPSCTEPGRQYRVTMSVYNMLTQLVAYPELFGSVGGVAGGTLLNNVLLPCGNYTARWDGKIRSNGREAPSGIYYFQLNVNGVQVSVKAIVGK